MRIGLVGLGYMGAPMGRRLVECGHTLTVFDIDAARNEELREKGGTIAASPAAVGAESDVVFISLSSIEAIRAAVFDENDGLLTTMEPGSTLVDLSTNAWSLTIELAERARERRVGFLDCPVSAAGGGPASGTMTLMVGGDDDVVERCRAVLDDLGMIHHVGPTGSGTVAKLVTQQIGYISTMAALEAIVVAEKAGLDLDILFEIIPVSAARGRLSPQILEDLKKRDFGDPERGRPGAPVYIIEKDVKLALQLGKELGVPTELVGAGYELLANALERGWDDYNFIRAIEVIEERAGITPE